MKKIKVITLIVIFLCSFFISNTIYAHTMLFSQGSESLGYKVGPQHASKSSLTYKIETTTSYIALAASTGATRWQNTGLVTVKVSSTSNNKIWGHYNKNTSTIAYNEYTYNTSTNIIISFNISFNDYYMMGYTDSRRNKIGTHEWGHSFGLKDLYNDSNTGKIMYGYGNLMTANNPTATDKTGLKIGIQ